MARTRFFRTENLFELASCISLFLIGWNDGSTGPLIPVMQNYYHIDYIVVSMIFICNCVGCMCAAVINLWVSDKFGFGTTVVAGAVLQGVGLAIECTRPPFPIMALAYFIGGLGLAFQIAQNNSFVTTLPTSPQTKLMIAHGCYGFGAFVSPLVSTQFAKTSRWQLHYLTGLALSIVNAISLSLVFRWQTQSQVLKRIGVENDTESEITAVQQTSSSTKFFDLMRLKIVHVIALFIFVYVGTEVTLGAWSVSFLIHSRSGGSSSGYVSSGFFGGLALGRFALIWVNKLIGPTRVIYVYCVVCIGLELTIWFIPNLVENAFAISLVGFFMGPQYPTIVMIMSRIIPPRLFGGAIGWISCTGSTGAAVFPFVLAAMAQKLGVSALQPLLVGLLSLMIGLWTLALYYRPKETDPSMGALPPPTEVVLDLQELPGRPRLEDMRRDTMLTLAGSEPDMNVATPVNEEKDPMSIGMALASSPPEKEGVEDSTPEPASAYPNDKKIAPETV
ncbi:MFS general substrate transporter [Clavulina sp. PMI_390]|nr:MFS general substrate transporter [Clavulina sp. PMI_390]